MIFKVLAAQIWRLCGLVAVSSAAMFAHQCVKAEFTSANDAGFTKPGYLKV